MIPFLKLLNRLLGKTILLPALIILQIKAYAQECQDEVSLSLISESTVLAQTADSMGQKFSAIRKEHALVKKLDQLLSQTIEANKILKSGPDPLKMPKATATQYATQKDRLETLQKATSEESVRIQNAISRARKSLQDKKLKPSEIQELEFSVNSLLEVYVSRLRSISTGAKEDAENQNTFCLMEQGDLDRAPVTKKSAEFRAMDAFLFGVVINPLRWVAASGKYNMSLTRIEMLNERHKPPPTSLKTTGSSQNSL